jgi:hypothetical protein
MSEWPSRVKKGFRRLGLVVALPLSVLGVFLIIIGFINYILGVRHYLTDQMVSGFWVIVFALLWYLLARAIGWVVAGFLGD